MFIVSCYCCHVLLICFKPTHKKLDVSRGWDLKIAAIWKITGPQLFKVADKSLSSRSELRKRNHYSLDRDLIIGWRVNPLINFGLLLCWSAIEQISSERRLKRNIGLSIHQWLLPHTGSFHFTSVIQKQWYLRNSKNTSSPVPGSW